MELKPEVHIDLFEAIRRVVARLLKPISRHFSEQWYLKTSVRSIYGPKDPYFPVDAGEWRRYWDLLLVNPVNEDTKRDHRKPLLSIVTDHFKVLNRSPLKLLILGRPEGSKTLTLKFFLTYFATIRWDRKAVKLGAVPDLPNMKFPFYFNLNDWTGRDGTFIPATNNIVWEPLLEAIQSKLKGLGCAVLARDLEDDLDKGKYLLLFDFDKGLSSLEVFNMVDAFSEQFQLNDYICVCRESIFRPFLPVRFTNYERVVIISLNREELEARIIVDP